MRQYSDEPFGLSPSDTEKFVGRSCSVTSKAEQSCKIRTSFLIWTRRKCIEERGWNVSATHPSQTVRIECFGKGRSFTKLFLMQNVHPDA